MWTRITRIFSNLSPLVPDRRSETRAPALAPLPLAHSAAGGERLYATGVADERDHDGDAADEEDALHHMHAVRAQIQVAGDRPATGEGGAENLLADQNRRAEHGHYVLPGDLASLAGARWAAHASAPIGCAICANGASESSLGLGIQATKSPNCGAAPRRTAPHAASRAFAWRSPASASAARMRSISTSASLTSGGRTTARGKRPSSTSASFMRLCMSAQGSAWNTPASG